MKFRRDAQRLLLSEPGVRALVADAAEDVAEEIRHAAPVRSGVLRDGVQATDPELGRTGWHALVEFLAWYSLVVEFGPTGRPFIRPGADAALRRYRSRLEGERK